MCFGGVTNHTHLSIENPVDNYNLIKMGFTSTSFLKTGADILSLFVCLYVINMLIEVVRLIFEDNDSINKSLERIKSSMLLGYITFSFTKLAFASHLNLFNYNTGDP